MPQKVSFVSRFLKATRLSADKSLLWSQVQATFAGGLAEHLQAAGGANAAVVASLKESAGRVGAAADTLSSQVSEGQRRLLQLAEEAAAAGTSHQSVLCSVPLNNCRD